jgi:hypothetical protein
MTCRIISLHEPTQNIEFVFPEPGMIKVVVTKDGEPWKWANGNEATLSGLAAGRPEVVREIIRRAMLPNDWTVDASPRPAAVKVILNRHTDCRDAGRTAACNRLHDIQQRLSRWLMTQDRVNLAMCHPRFHRDHDGHRPIHGESGSRSAAKRVIDYARR